MPSGCWDPQEEAFHNRKFNPSIGGHNDGAKSTFTLYVVGIPPELSNLALKNLFHSYGNVTSAKVLPPKSDDFEAKAGFVEFSTLREAESAIRNLNGSRIGKYTLKVSFARSKKKEKSEYMDLIQKLELGPLIDADLKCLIKKTDEEMEEAKLEVNGEGDGCRGSSSKSSQGSKSPEREPIPHFNNDQDVQKHEEKVSNAKLLPCDICSKLTSTACSSCSVVHYCSVSCQKKGWPAHKKICKKLKDKEKVGDEPSDDNKPLIYIDDAVCKKVADDLKSKSNPAALSQPNNKRDLLKPFVSIGAVLELVVTDVDQKSCILLCQNVDSQQELDKMQKALNNFYVKAPAKSVTDAKVGDVCACVFAEDGQWYRAIVLQLNNKNQKARIEFVDYGNKQVVDLPNLKILEDEFRQHPAFMLKCKLAGCDVEGGWSDDVISFLGSVLPQSDFKIKATVVNFIDGVVIANVVSGVAALNEQLLENNLVKPSTDAKCKDMQSCRGGAEMKQTPAQVEPSCVKEKTEVATPDNNSSNLSDNDSKSSVNSSLSTAEITTTKKEENLAADAQVPTPRKIVLPSAIIPEASFSAVISHVDSPDYFFCQSVQENLVEVNKQLQNLTEFYSLPENKVVFFPFLGDICAALFPEDGCWYRAKILELGDDLVEVQYLDFGNSHKVSLEQVQPLPEKYQALPVQCFPAKLSNCFPLETGKWSEDATLLLKSCENTPLAASVDQASSSEDLVSLILQIDDSLTLNDHLVSSGLAAAHPPPLEEEEIPSVSSIIDKNPPLNDVIPIIVTSCSKPGTFSCHMISEEIAAFTGFSIKLNRQLAAGKNPTLSNPAHGSICAAFYKNDKSWYRASILSLDGDKVFVKYVDFGNTAWLSIKEICPLPLEYGSMPCQAIDCVLASTKPADDAGWKENFVTTVNTMLSQPLEAKFLCFKDDCYVCVVPEMTTLLIQEGAARMSF
ncbi:tudor domain-containing protein 1-like [Clavelina lepadiformis]|uniref:tudor domain-containing protein 1-like n=1 Tax=Clavelina lepadiformis TaxID=159417 RepID=UPI004041632F